MLMEFAPLAKAMFSPATRLTLLEEAFSEKLVATGTTGPMIVICGFVDD